MNILNGIRRPKTSMEAKVAEGVGFEPTEVFTFAGFQDQCFLPLNTPPKIIRFELPLKLSNLIYQKTVSNAEK